MIQTIHSTFKHLYRSERGDIVCNHKAVRLFLVSGVCINDGSQILKVRLRSGEKNSFHIRHENYYEDIKKVDIWLDSIGDGTPTSQSFKDEKYKWFK